MRGRQAPQQAVPLWLRWIAGNAAALGAAGMLVVLEGGDSFAVLPLFALCAAVAQWLTLRAVVVRAWRWLPLTIFGVPASAAVGLVGALFVDSEVQRVLHLTEGTLPRAVLVVISSLCGAAVGGATLGAAQLAVLAAAAGPPWWWVAASAAGWVLAAATDMVALPLQQLSEARPADFFLLPAWLTVPAAALLGGAIGLAASAPTGAVFSRLQHRPTGQAHAAAAA